MNKNYNIKALLPLFLLLLLATGAWCYYYNNAFIALPYNDAMDYASMARNISLGRGFTSRYITPLSLAHYGAPYPNLWRGPLWPLFLAGYFRFFPATDSVVATASGFFYLIALFPLYYLAKELAGKLAGFLSCLLYIFSPPALFYSVSGMTESMALFFMVLWVFLLLKSPERGFAFFFLTGAVAGLFYLVRYNAIVFLPLSCLYLYWSTPVKNRFPKLALYLGAWLFFTLPWLWRNYSLTGNPFFSLQSFEPAMFTASYPTYTLYMLPQIIDVWAFLRQHPGELLLKIKEGLNSFYKEIFDPAFTGVATFLAILFLPGALSPRQIKIKLFVVACFLAQLGALLVVHYIPRLFFIFLPFYIIFALCFCTFFFQLFRSPACKVILLGIVTAIALSGNLPEWHKNNSWYNWPVDYAPAISDVSRQTTTDGVIISNDGHILSWYADRLALKMPVKWEQVAKLEKMAPVEGIWLSNSLFWGNTPEADKEWLEIMREKPPVLDNYYLFAAYEDNSLLYLRKTEQLEQ
ncbi:MAG: glycosyltransferase family 39 protein [Firmicutes bacterium]|nr:glycosyltransferase family 39 protein [Bacillota bacterium]